LDVTLEARFGPAMMGGRAVTTYTFNGHAPGPTLRLHPGDSLGVTLTNQMDQPTNLHTHGLHVSPAGNSDNVFVHLMPGETFSNEQLYHYYLGDPLEVFMLHADGSSERVVVGPDIPGGGHLQLRIPGNTFHTARVIGRGCWFLGGSTEWPGVVPADVEIGNVDELAGNYPAVAADLRAIAASVQEVVPSVAGPQ
jgi:hypothetical protein